MTEKKMVIRYVTRQVVSTDQHCSNDCPGMSLNAKYCRYFHTSLTWDSNKNENGNLRLMKCRQHEMHLRED